jgi:hypothetical protein
MGSYNVNFERLPIDLHLHIQAFELHQGILNLEAFQPFNPRKV